MKMQVTAPLLFLLKINSSSRILLTGMLLSLLWFIIYYNAREYFFHPLYFIMPSLLILLILTVIPSILARRLSMSNGMTSGNNDGNALLEGFDTSNMQVEEVRLAQQTSMEGNADVTGEVQDSNSIQQVPIDESVIQQIVDEKMASLAGSVSEAVQKATDAANTVNSVKADIENLKKSVKDLTEAFETTLVDFKAFQAEIANPLNFMRKYFDQLSIDALSDPTLPLQKSDININGNGGGDGTTGAVTAYTASNDQKSEPNSNNNERRHTQDTQNSKVNRDESATHDANIDTDTGSGKGILSLAQANGITLTTLMELILTIGEFMKRFGNQYSSILYVQCKLLNLSSDAERIVYSIVDMLGRSTLTPEECAESLYMLADVLGLKDRDADTLYARLRMNVKSSQIGRGADDQA